MSDLETRIRDALRADEIGWDDLRQPTLRVARRSPKRWPIVLATAAAVAAVATVAALIAVNGNGNKNGSAGTQPAYAGYDWQMTALTDHGGPISDLASAHASIAFSDTAVVGSLHGASIFGHYQPTPHGYDVSHVGVAGRVTNVVSGNKLRIGTAFADLFVNAHARRESASSAIDFNNNAAVAVTARVSGDQLVLQANGVTMHLLRVGRSQVSPIIDAVGYTWNVQTLTDKHGRLTIPDRLRAKFAFDRYGELFVRQGANTLTLVSGFRPSSDGYVPFGVTAPAVGYAGHDLTVTRVIAALDAMVQNKAAVTATVDGDTLTLHRNGITLTLQRGAAVPIKLLGGGSASATLVPVPPRHSYSFAPPGAPSSLPFPSVSAGRGAPGSHH